MTDVVFKLLQVQTVVQKYTRTDYFTCGARFDVSTEYCFSLFWQEMKLGLFKQCFPVSTNKKAVDPLES
jgi:hypothetical protein